MATLSSLVINIDKWQIYNNLTFIATLGLKNKLAQLYEKIMVKGVLLIGYI